MKLILASQSPRRRELLSMITPDFAVRVSRADETVDPSVPPDELVQTLARRKAEAVLAGLEREAAGGCCVVGADTVVVVGGQILGKPASREDCVRMLGLLSGRAHFVYTGVAALAPGGRRVFYDRTEVEFYPLTPGEIAWYASTAEPYDKAGGYGIQGLGAVLVKGIRGDFFSVMGLPVARLYRVLKELGALKGR